MEFKDALPKTNEEIDLWFEFLDLYEARKKATLPYSIQYPMQDAYKSNYENKLKEYLKRINS